LTETLELAAPGETTGNGRGVLTPDPVPSPPAETDPAQWTADLGEGHDLPVRVSGTRDDGTVVIEGTINLWISPKR